MFEKSFPQSEPDFFTMSAMRDTSVQISSVPAILHGTLAKHNSIFSQSFSDIFGGTGSFIYTFVYIGIAL